jgi:cytochrome c peroxidase
MTIANDAATNRAILTASLAHQALDATINHAQGTVPLTALQQQKIVDFELDLATAQIKDNDTGSLTAHGALGGPENIFDLPFYIGINDNVADPHGPFNAVSMHVFDAWTSVNDDDRASVARGQALFNAKPIVISGVKGLNNNPYFGSPVSFTGTCTTCHNTPNVGNHSLAIALDIGLTDGSRRTPDMPLYTLRNKATFETVTTTDPGLALSTGKWNDIGRFKGPVLRGLAARAPYFHNGFAKRLEDVVDFYQQRFGVVFTHREKTDLVAFLRSL